ncbi:conjugal transfer protein TraV [Limosilactobacillus reuteri]|uniref:Conjugal transfer protein TraV n=1 Tax=Limosilactobacillus reuteri TaxID=1598 RepID=A0A1Y4NNY3_LIMRT|nr:conjugal transfer protein TraV [Limosilactobacillus reuteri]PEG78587.1 conjugal transfer protein TraV [Lactobacillus sp. UMNPBX18]PEG88296.1 conjugal transfer protein TraV [Lactobacillus sp. UMNPBX13]PEG99769.1 conjugal transfer protein TraV [Lactobacillus sp. UMNPBX7]MQB61752.1 conjugal transfer protein TraV [Limosilactobacillus reuteri]
MNEKGNRIKLACEFLVPLPQGWLQCKASLQGFPRYRNKIRIKKEAVEKVFSQPHN